MNRSQTRFNADERKALTHNKSPIALERTIVARRPSADASSPSPIHTPCPLEAKLTGVAADKTVCTEYVIVVEGRTEVWGIVVVKVRIESVCEPEGSSELEE